jgi:hypothetical protein
LAFEGDWGLRSGEEEEGVLRFLALGDVGSSCGLMSDMLYELRWGQVSDFALVARKSGSSRSWVSNVGIRRELLLDIYL